MSHDLFGTRFVSYRTAGWHRLGTVFEEDDLSLVEAFARARLDYLIGKYPLTVTTPWGDVADSARVALVREPLADDDDQPRLLSIVSSDYGLIQNRDLALAFEPLSRQWPVETAGALGQGERVFFTLRAGQCDIAGDAVEEYFLVFENRTGDAGLTIQYCTQRVVCANTLAVALREGRAGATLVHTADVLDRVKVERDVLVALKTRRDAGRRALETLARTPVTDDQADAIFRAASPDPKAAPKFRFAGRDAAEVGLDLYRAEQARHEGRESGYQFLAHRAAALRSVYRQAYVRQGEAYPRLASTAWGAVNAVTEVADHRVGSGETEAGLIKAAQSAQFGDRAVEKSRALLAALAIAGVN